MLALAARLALHCHHSVAVELNFNFVDLGSFIMYVMGAMIFKFNGVIDMIPNLYNTAHA